MILERLNITHSWSPFRKKVVKYLFACLLLTCLPMVLQGQGFERKRANLPVIGEPITVLKKANGWALQDNGIWIQGNNSIPHTNADMNRGNDPEYKLGRHNFLEMQFREVLINGEQFMVLLVFSRGGVFEFQTLRQGWKPRMDVSYYVFKSNKLRQLLPDTLALGSTRLTNMEIFCMDRIENFDKDNFLLKIANHIQRQAALKQASQFNLLFSVQQVVISTGKMVRFRLIDVYNKKSIYNRYFLPDNLPHLLDRFYYEIPYGDFLMFTRTVPLYDDLIADPKTFMEFYRRGVAFFNRKEFGEAASDFERALMLPSSETVFHVYAYLGNCYHEMGNYTEALRNFDIAIDNKPDDRSLMNDWARVLYNRGITRFTLKDKSDACDDWNKASIYGIPEADLKVKKHCRR